RVGWPGPPRARFKTAIFAGSKKATIGSPHPHCLFAPSPAPFLTVESPIKKSVGGFAFAPASCAEEIPQNSANARQVNNPRAARIILFDKRIKSLHISYSIFHISY